MAEPPRGGISRPRACTRWSGGTLGGCDEEQCGAEPVSHVIWSDSAGFVCPEHLAEIDAKGWDFVVRHAVGPACGMPGAYVDYERNCCVPGDIEVAEPVRTLAVAMPASGRFEPSEAASASDPSPLNPAVKDSLTAQPEGDEAAS